MKFDGCVVYIKTVVRCQIPTTSYSTGM